MSSGRYKGAKRRGMMHGKGTYYYDDGSRYEGLFQNNKKHGKGIFYYPSGGRFEGMFKNDEMTKGKYFIPGQGRFEGEMKDDCPHGKGIFYFDSGGKYDGDWKDGLMHGQGALISKNGNYVEGPWIENKRHGRFMRSLIDGSCYEGEFKDNEQIGEWKMFVSPDITSSSSSTSSTTSQRPPKKQTTRTNPPQQQPQMMTSQMMMMSPEQRMSMMMNIPGIQPSSTPPAKVVEKPFKVDNLKRYAFLVGQNQGKLRFCQDDAKKMERKLTRYGYQCFRYSDVDYSKFRKFFNRFASVVQPKSKVIVYYSGHGYMKDGQNYLCCFKESKFDDDMKLSFLIKRLRAKNSLNFIFLDCCQKSGDEDDMYKSKAGGSGSGTPISINANANDGQFVFGYACLPGLVSYESAGGVYTKYLLSHMDQQTEIIKVLKLTAKDLKMNERQSGYFASTAFDDLYL